MFKSLHPDQNLSILYSSLGDLHKTPYYIFWRNIMQEDYLYYEDHIADVNNMIENKRKYKERDRKIENSFVFEELLSKEDIEKLKQIR
ncbi:MAG TPA: hypothetical protein VK982_01860 [Bacteroidales bacterium]|nr:hypothetical protein [Bacteroidales bacterium]